MEAAEALTGSAVGARLREAREKRGLTVAECAERLYLPVTVISALENEEFAQLGAGIYARSHVRRYATLLELDAAELEQILLQRLVAAPDLTAIVTRRVLNTQPGRRLGVLPVVIAAVVLAFVVLVWWSSRQPIDPVPVAVPVVVPNAVPVTPDNSAAPAASPAAPDKATAAPLPRAAVEPSAARAPDDARAEAPRPAASPLVIATAPVRRPPADAAAAAASPASKTAPAKSPATARGGAATAPPRAAAPQQDNAPPVVEAPPRETQRDYMNFDF